jgi:hypothetical protein
VSESYQSLLEDPASIVGLPYNSYGDLTQEQLHEVHLAGTRRRFAELKDKVTALGRLADEQGVTQIETLDDVVPLLFKHTAYKSYPMSFLERNRFDALTRWLDGMTSLDLSGLDASGIETIDDWLRFLEANTDLTVHHTFGTTGKLSFIPRTAGEWADTVKMTGIAIRDVKGPGSGPDLFKDHLPLIAPTYRKGFSTTARSINGMVEYFAGGDANALFLYPDGYVSADLASLAGRLRSAETRGEEGQLRLAPTLLARREEFMRMESERPTAMREFLETAREKFGGQDVFLFGFWPVLYDWAEEGLAQGIKGLFGKNSVLVTGGGTKGRVMPEGWRERIFEFFGFSNFYDTFGMSEMCGGNMACSVGNYHFPPITVPFVLDLETGAPLPREGRQTGRLAVMDLMARTYWGGLVSGDLVTVGGWDEPCSCGRTGPYLDPDIRRVADITGGEDKINCAGAPAAHDRALEFLVSRSVA